MAKWMFALLSILTLLQMAQRFIPHLRTKNTHAAQAQHPPPTSTKAP